MADGSARQGDTGVVPYATATAIVSFRDRSIELVTEGATLIARGHALTAEAAALAQQAHGDAVFRDVDHAAQEDFRRLFVRFDADASVEAFRKHTDARTWVRLVGLAGIERLMDRTERDKFFVELAGSVPPVTEDAIRDVLEALAGDAQLIFVRGLARVFSDLDKRFKSHDAFRIGSRMILTRLFDEWGSWNYHNSARATIADVERVFAVLDGKPPNPGALEAAVNEGRRGHGPRQGTCESPYFRIHTFKNGNAHLWFTRDDLVAKANEVLADYYGAVLPDAVPAGGPEADLRSSSRELSRDLAFYRSPPAVGQAALAGMDIGPESHVLEPSAGDGALVELLLARGARVTAIEVDADRHAALERLARGAGGRLTVVRANFLQTQATPQFTHVVANPPFSGTHWMDHVVHAFGFLAPGGRLVSVLPATAEVAESRKHEEFRAWAEARAERRWCVFEALPPESFAASGTRVQTVLLRLRRER